MDITIHGSFLPHEDPDACLAIHRDTLCFGVRNDVGCGAMRWMTVGPAGNLIRINELRRAVRRSQPCPARTAP
jgi:hypothetical protein